MNVRVLGQVAAVADGRSIPLGGRRQRAVLAGLIAHGPEGATTGALVDLVWGDDPPPTARKSLQTYVARLRQLLGPDAIGTRPDGYAWTFPPDRVDATRFEGIVRKDRAGEDPARTWDDLSEALGLWRGEPFSDVDGGPALAAFVRRLHELRLEAIELRAAAGTASGHHREVVADMQAMVESHPLREGLWEQLLLALEAAGRPAAAIEAYGRCRERLADELGVDPSDRLQELAERLLRRAPAAEPERQAMPVSSVARNPYKGLRAFHEDDDIDFFGREALVDTLVARLEQTRFLALVGPSGAGKSSLVLAGLVPAMRRRDDGRTLVATMSPGTHPFAHLESAVATASPTNRLATLHRRGDDLDLLRWVLTLVPGGRDELVLVIDQFEELLTGAVAPAEVDAFVRNLAEAVEDPQGHLRVVVTLRADLLDAALRHGELAELLGTGTVHVPPLTAVQLQSAVVGPARAVGLEIEPELVTELVAQTVQHPGWLPLLQFILTELVDEAEGTTLTLGALDRAGGVRGVLARRAEQVHDRLTPAARAASRLLFLRLVVVNDVGEASRRVLALEDLDVPSDAEVATRDAVDAFVRARLLVRDRDPTTGRATVQVAHEAVLREWPRCAEWVEQAAADLRAGLDLERAAATWAAAGRSPDFLLTGDRLRAHEDAIERSDVGASRVARAYLAASVEHWRRTEAAEAARADRERLLERRAVQRLRAVVAVLLVLGVVTTSLSVYALQRRDEAERDRRQIQLATAETLVRRLAFAAAAGGQDPQTGLLLALHAVRTATTADVPVPKEVVEALHLALQAAGVPYPVDDDAPVALVTGVGGPVGALDLPLQELVALARANVVRQLSPAECRVHLATADCPVLPAEMADGLPAATLASARPAGPMALEGTTVRITGVSDDDGVVLRRQLREFSEATGIEVTFSADGVFDDGTLSAGEVAQRADIVIVANASHIRAESEAGRLMDLGRYLSVDQLRSDVGAHLVSLATPPDDEGDTADSPLFAVPVYGVVKSLVWYSPERFAEAGYSIPTSWDELIALSDAIVADGGTPWCFGEESDDASGWPATDWVEDLLLHEHGPEVYDAWVAGDIGFSDPRVVDAFERLGRLVFTDGYTRGGGPGAVQTHFESAPLGIVADPPDCWMLHQASFLAGWLPFEVEFGRDIDVFTTPSITPEHAGGTLVQAHFALVYSDRPEVREVVRYLAGPDVGRILVNELPVVMFNRRFTPTAYAIPRVGEIAAEVSAAIDDDLLRNDASDTMPPEIGTEPLWSAMTAYLREGPEALDSILARLDAIQP